MTELLITLLASFLIWVMYGGLLVLWLIDGKIKREQALHALISSFFAWLLAQMIKGLFPTERPFMENGVMPLTLIVSSDGAFPSGHTAAAFALAVSIWLHDKKLGSVYLVAALLIGAARVAGNVHYPFDIIGGAAVGTILAFVVDKLHVYKLLNRKRP